MRGYDTRQVCSRIRYPQLVKKNLASCLKHSSGLRPLCALTNIVGSESSAIERQTICPRCTKHLVLFSKDRRTEKPLRDTRGVCTIMEKPSQNPGGVHNGWGMPRERRGLGHALVTVATGQEPKAKPVKCLGSMVPCPNPMLL